MGVYSCNESMIDTAFFSSDGDILIVPQIGKLTVMTECGLLTAEPWHIIVIPRGIKFSVSVAEDCRGYYCEIYDGHFTIPDLGPIGTNGNANPRDFEYRHRPPEVFALPVLTIVIITLLNDGTIISIAYDKVTVSRTPNKWNLVLIFSLAILLGGIAFVSSLVMLLIGLTNMPSSGGNSFL